MTEVPKRPTQPFAHAINISASDPAAPPVPPPGVTPHPEPIIYIIGSTGPPSGKIYGRDPPDASPQVRA